MVDRPSRPLKTGLSVDKCLSCGAHKPRIYLRAPDRYHGRTTQYELVRCASCSLVWLANPPRPEEMGEHYGPAYDRSVTIAGEDPNRWQERWKTLASLKNGGTLLDLGCSAGGFLVGMRGAQWRLFGVEMSEEVAAQARERTGAEVFAGDILDAPFAPNSFDVITCFHVFEHLYRPDRVIQKVSEWLKPGGLFYLIVPNIHSAGARIFGSHWYALELPRHLFHYSPRSLKMMARSAGLTPVSVTTRRELFVEKSLSYLIDSASGNLRLKRTPMAFRATPSIAFRVVRKLLRLTIVPLANMAGSLAGDGESIHAIFKKP